MTIQSQNVSIIYAQFLTKFLNETDLEAKDIAVQIQSGDEVVDLVIRVDEDNLHLVLRNNAVEEGHVQMDPIGLYMNGDGAVKLLRYATVVTFMQDLAKEVDAMMDTAIESIPEDEQPTEAEIKKAVDELNLLASAAKAQEQVDAVTVSSAAAAFIGKFKPEYILDVKEEQGSMEISLRSEAFATALAEALDEVMSNPDLAELVDRKAAQEGGQSFAKYQQEWASNREATLEAIRTIESTGMIDENGHLTTHFQIGEALSETKTLVCDSDAWIDLENGKVDATVNLGFKDEEPFLIFNLAIDPDSYRETLTAGDSMTDIEMYFEGGQLSSGKVLTVIEGKEWLRAEAGSDYMFVKGPKGGISTSVRETWAGKTRYELFIETAEGEEASVIFDFYQEDDSLVVELSSNEPDQTVMFKLSRIDKLNIDDLSASENIDEITLEKINAELESLLKMVIPAARTE